MSKIRRRSAGFAAIAGATLVTMVATAATSGAVVDRAPNTAKDVKLSGGHCVAHISDTDIKYDSVVPLSSNPFTREYFFTNHGSVKLKCDDDKNLPSKFTLEVGYQIAPTADVSDGLSLGITPALNTSNNQLTISTPVSHKIKAGQITEAAVAKRDYAKADKTEFTPAKPTPKSGDININGWHAQLNNAVGVVKIRSYVKLTSSSGNADDINVLYSRVVDLRG